MFELIPSKDIRAHLEEINHEFTDAEKATIIYNTVKEITIRYDLLLDLAESTDDQDLIVKIKERFAFYQKCRELFINDDQGCYYMPSYLDAGREWVSNGAFGNYVIAKSEVEELVERNAGTSYRIEKYQIYGDRHKEIKGHLRKNRRLCSFFYNDKNVRCYEEYNLRNLPVATAEYNEEGVLIDLYSEEMPIEEVEKLNDWGEKRFDDKFIYIPMPFEPGEVVYSVTAPDQIGVINMSKESINGLR